MEPSFSLSGLWVRSNVSVCLLHAIFRSLLLFRAGNKEPRGRLSLSLSLSSSREFWARSRCNKLTNSAQTSLKGYFVKTKGTKITLGSWSLALFYKPFSLLYEFFLCSFTEFQVMITVHVMFSAIQFHP